MFKRKMTRPYVSADKAMKQIIRYSPCPRNNIYASGRLDDNGALILLDEREIEMPDSRKRSLFKGIVWRSIAVVASFIVAYLVTGGLTVSLKLTVIGNMVSATLYYFHERFWAGVKWGKV